MPELAGWRIDKSKWAGCSFDGSGAAERGGRWNSAGVRVVYVSANLAMAAQEKFIHLPKPLPSSMSLVRFRVEFAASLVQTIRSSWLPVHWRLAPIESSTQRLGDRWALGLYSAVLAVPSAIIPEETNYLLNPLHPDFKKVRIGPPEPFAYDYRFARLIEPDPQRPNR